jgi:hypothetical protein
MSESAETTWLAARVRIARTERWRWPPEPQRPTVAEHLERPEDPVLQCCLDLTTHGRHGASTAGRTIPNLRRQPETGRVIVAIADSPGARPDPSRLTDPRRSEERRASASLDARR